MRLFKKKVTCEEYKQFQKKVQKSLRKQKRQNRYLEKKARPLKNITLTLSELRKQLDDLQNEFAEFTCQFKKDSPVHDKSVIHYEKEQEKPMSIPPKEISDNDSFSLSPMEQKGLIFIGKIQDESKSQMISVGSLSTGLYPDWAKQKSNTTVSNILKKLKEHGLILRERRGNYWYIGLTAKGYKMIKKFLQ